MDFSWLYTLIIDNNINIIFELISTLFVLLTLWQTPKFWLISTICIGVIAFFFVDNTILWSLFIVNVTFTALSFLGKLITKFYFRIDNLRYNAKKNNQTTTIGYNILIKVLGLLFFFLIIGAIFFGMQKRVLSELSWHIGFLLLFPILSIFIYFLIHFFSEIKKMLFLNFFLKNDINDFRSDLEKIGLSGYIENISEKQVEEMINLKILDFIINFLRRDIKEADVIFALHKEIERASEEERKEIFSIITKMNSFIEKMNTEFGYNYLSQVSKSVKQQSLQDSYKVEIIYILYLVHIIGRYDKLKDHYIHGGKTDGAMDKVIKNNKMHKKAGSKKIFEEVVDIF